MDVFDMNWKAVAEFLQKYPSSKTFWSRRLVLHWSCLVQGAFHVVNREDLRREIELPLGVAAYSLRP